MAAVATPCAGLDLPATPSGFTLGGVAAYERYREPALGVTEQGMAWGALAGGTVAAGLGWHLGAGLEWDHGRVRYQGSGSRSGVPDDQLDCHLALGRDWALGQRAVLAPWTGFGVRMEWNDLRGTTSTGALGYRRASTLKYVPLGCAVRVALGCAWVFAPMVEYDWVVRARAVSRLGDAGTGLGTALNHPDSGHGWRLEVMAETRRTAFGPWLRYWSLGASDTVPVGQGYRAQEPGNSTLEAGVRATWRFGGVRTR